MTHVAPVTLVTVGYEDRTVAELLEVLQDHDVEVLVDVRLSPVSRKAGFSKAGLAASLAGSGIEYVHEPLLGNPPENRAPFHDGRVELGRARYLRRLLGEGRPAYERVLDLARHRTVALMCFEREQEWCHRHCIAQQALVDVPDLVVVPA